MLFVYIYITFQLFGCYLTSSSILSMVTEKTGKRFNILSTEIALICELRSTISFFFSEEKCQDCFYSLHLFLADSLVILIINIIFWISYPISLNGLGANGPLTFKRPYSNGWDSTKGQQGWIFTWISSLENEDPVFTNPVILTFTTIKIITSWKISNKQLWSWLTRRSSKVFGRTVRLMLVGKVDMQNGFTIITVDRIPDRFTSNLKVCTLAVVQ